jgi:hypothetical protein
LNEEMKDKMDAPIDRIEKAYKHENPSLKDTKDPVSFPLRLNEMITLSVMKSSHETGIIKKVIHAPTLKMFAVKVI